MCGHNFYQFVAVFRGERVRQRTNILSNNKQINRKGFPRYPFRCLWGPWHGDAKEASGTRYFGGSLASLWTFAAFFERVVADLSASLGQHYEKAHLLFLLNFEE